MLRLKSEFRSPAGLVVGKILGSVIAFLYNRVGVEGWNRFKS